jgi:WD40 repeat protein
VHLRPLPTRDANEKQRQQIAALLLQLDEDSIDKRESACADLLKIGLPAEPLLKQAAKESKSAEVRMRARKVREQMLSKIDVRIECDPSEIDAAAFSPDGKNVAGAGRDGYVYVWDVATRKQIERLLPASSR